MKKLIIVSTIFFLFTPLASAQVSVGLPTCFAGSGESGIMVNNKKKLCSDFLAADGGSTKVPWGWKVYILDHHCSSSTSWGRHYGPPEGATCKNDSRDCCAEIGYTYVESQWKPADIKTVLMQFSIYLGSTVLVVVGIACLVYQVKRRINKRKKYIND